MAAPPPTGIADQARRALFSQLMKATQREFDLLEKVPHRFKLRGWDCDDRMAIATMALCCVAMRQPDIKIEVFKGTDDPECWAKIVGTSTAQQIVDALDMRDLIKPRKRG